MGKQLLFDALGHKKVERPPWVVFSGVHSGKLKGYMADEVLMDGDKLYESLLEVHRLYSPDGMPIIFDLQVEAEILGCELSWVKESSPLVTSHPLASDDKIPGDKTLPGKEDGRLPMILEVMKKAKETIGKDTGLYGLICGPLTLAFHLRGTNLITDFYDHPSYVMALMEYTTKVCLKMTEYYMEAKMDVIAYVDPLVSLITKDTFETFLGESYTKLFDFVRGKSVFSAFFVCGDATKNIEAMCKTKPDSISIDENIDMGAAKKITDHYNITLGGNLQLTKTMLHGSQQANMKAVIEIIDRCGHQNLIISPGCDLPYDTPLGNVIAVSQAVRNFDQIREVVRNVETSLDLDGVRGELPDYGACVKPLVEVFTFDSASCAACGYMMSVAHELQKEQRDVFDLMEYKYTRKENILRGIKLGVKNLPCLYINGELIYSSIIPSKQDLLRKIKEWI